MDRFKAKISKMGKDRIIKVPTRIKEYFPGRTRVEVTKVNESNAQELIDECECDENSKS